MEMANLVKSKENALSPWSVDLAELEMETNEILSRFGKKKLCSKSSRMLSSAAPFYGNRGDNTRPPRKASSYRSSRLGNDEIHGSKKGHSRNAKSTTLKHHAKERTNIDKTLRLHKVDESAQNQQHLLRRKYRTEDVQKIFSCQSKTLVFDPTQEQFLSHEESKHPIYRLVQQHISSLNFTFQRRQNTKLWLASFIHKLKEGSFQNNQSAQSARILCLKGTQKNMAQVKNLFSDKLSRANVRASMKGQMEQEQMQLERLVDIRDIKMRSNFIIAGPPPVPHALYRPRKYDASAPTKIILNANKRAMTDVLQINHRAENNDLSLLNLSSLYQDTSNFVDYVTFRRKGSNGCLATGGLSVEILVSRQFTSCFPPQYKGLTCSDDTILVPVTRTTNPAFFTLEVPPDRLQYIRRDLVTPLDTRRPPTVMTKVGISKDDRYYFGLNRVEQTGEEEDFGFRTSTWYRLPEPNDKIDTAVFKLSESIATPNALATTPFRTMKVDETYPFCPENSGINHVQDLRYLLPSHGNCSGNKLQVFTTMSSQRCGSFMQKCDISLPIGRVVTKVIRSPVILQGEHDAGQDPDKNPHANQVYNEEKTLCFGGDPISDRVLNINSRSDAKNAVIRTSIEDNGENECTMIGKDSKRPLLAGLLETVALKRVVKREVEYPRYSLNLSTPQCIQTSKPKSSLEEWADRGYNPWSDGKNPLSTHFVRSLTQEIKKWPKPNHNK